MIPEIRDAKATEEAAAQYLREHNRLAREAFRAWAQLRLVRASKLRWQAELAYRAARAEIDDPEPAS